MRRRITPEQVAEVKRLLAAGNTQRSTALLVGISRGSVTDIALWRRDVREENSRKKHSREARPRECEPYECQCGFIVNLKPCVICAARAAYDAKATCRKVPPAGS